MWISQSAKEVVETFTKSSTGLKVTTKSSKLSLSQDPSNNLLFMENTRLMKTSICLTFCKKDTCIMTWAHVCQEVPKRDNGQHHVQRIIFDSQTFLSVSAMRKELPTNESNFSEQVITNNIQFWQNFDAFFHPLINLFHIQNELLRISKDFSSFCLTYFHALKLKRILHTSSLSPTLKIYERLSSLVTVITESTCTVWFPNWRPH